jgi:hypothetical protein
MSGQGGITAPSLQESTVPTRRIMEVTIITIVLWDLGKGAIRLWTRKTWNATTQGSVAHTAAELTSIFV